MCPIKPHGLVFLNEEDGLNKEYSPRSDSTNKRDLGKYLHSGRINMYPCFFKFLNNYKYTLQWRNKDGLPCKTSSHNPS